MGTKNGYRNRLFRAVHAEALKRRLDHDGLRDLCREKHGVHSMAEMSDSQLLGLYREWTGHTLRTKAKLPGTRGSGDGGGATGDAGGPGSDGAGIRQAGNGSAGAEGVHPAAVAGPGAVADAGGRGEGDGGRAGDESTGRCGMNGNDVNVVLVFMVIAIGLALLAVLSDPKPAAWLAKRLGARAKAQAASRQVYAAVLAECLRPEEAQQ